MGNFLVYFQNLRSLSTPSHQRLNTQRSDKMENVPKKQLSVIPRLPCGRRSLSFD